MSSTIPATHHSRPPSIDTPSDVKLAINPVYCLSGVHFWFIHEHHGRLFVKNHNSLDVPKHVIRTNVIFLPCYLNVHLVQSWAQQLSTEQTSQISRGLRRAVNSNSVFSQTPFGCKQ